MRSRPQLADMGDSNRMCSTCLYCHFKEITCYLLSVHFGNMLYQHFLMHSVELWLIHEANCSVICPKPESHGNHRIWCYLLSEMWSVGSEMCIQIRKDWYPRHLRGLVLSPIPVLTFYTFFCSLPLSIMAKSLTCFPHSLLPCVQQVVTWDHTSHLAYEGL